MARDFDKELHDVPDHKYAYNFDLDVMHPFMIDAMLPFTKENGSVLELGGYTGAFTERLLERFPDVTSVEASGVAIEEARRRLPDEVTLVHSTFEAVELRRRYDHVVMTHVLEHLDDPVFVLSRINREWLAPDGRAFIICPNANAVSRQIAVKMGLLPDPQVVTPAEESHGHRVTYTLHTLERDARLAGLDVVHRSGIFFKALANFQWDALLETEIISKEYLLGCYKLGQQYPDLCSSIMLVCRPSAQG